MFFQNLFFVVCGLIIVQLYAHYHSDEPPHLKYSREINEAAQKNEKNSKKENYCHGHDNTCSTSSTEHDLNFDKHYSHSSGKINNKNKQEHFFNQNGIFWFLNDSKIRLWVYSIGSTLLISVFPCIILAFIPVQENETENSTLLKLLLAFGAGGLLGDAFLHLIPHAIIAVKNDEPQVQSHSHAHSHAHSHSHSHLQTSELKHGHSHFSHDMSVGQWVLIGFITFFITEKFVRILRGDDSHQHMHSHSLQKSVKKSKQSDLSDDDDSIVENLNKTSSSKKDEKVSLITHEPKICVAAYLNLIADFMHNFTDGLAIGASFIAGNTVGLVTMVTVLVHEIPHEIGDFAILVRSGCSKKKAMFVQLLTACGALLGCCISLWSVDAYALAEAAEQSWVLPFTAGGFIYIATVSIIPELLERSKFWQSVLEVLAIVSGIFLMFLIAIYE